MHFHDKNNIAMHKIEMTSICKRCVAACLVYQLFTQDVEHLAKAPRKQWHMFFAIGLFTQQARFALCELGPGKTSEKVPVDVKPASLALAQVV